VGLLAGYLVAIIVLVGSGIGALNWLVSPEPMQVQVVTASQAKMQKVLPATPPKTVAAALPVSEPAPDVKPAVTAEKSAYVDSVATELPDQHAPAVAEPPPVLSIPERSPALVTRARQDSTTSADAQQRRKATRSRPTIASRPRNRNRAMAHRQQSEMMILRTYEREDGSRFQQLLPASRSRALAFDGFGDR
jgi:hypothetical protein